MLKIFTLFFFALITLFCSSANASAPSTGDDACAAAASYSDGQDFVSELPDEILIQRIIPCLSPKEIKQLLCSSKHVSQQKPNLITAISKNIIWPDDVDEKSRYYCIEKMIDLELYLWPKKTSPFVLPTIVLMALKNTLTPELLSNPDIWELSLDNEYARLLAFAIMLDNNPAINVNKKIHTASGRNFLILHYAAVHGTAPLIRMLCKRGARVNIIETWRGDRPIHDAAHTGNIDTMQELIRQGTDLNADNAQGLTALHFAMINQYCNYALSFPAIILLLKHGANPYALTSIGANILNLARGCIILGEASPSMMTEIITYLEEFMATHPPELYE